MPRMVMVMVMMVGDGDSDAKDGDVMMKRYMPDRQQRCYGRLM